MGAGPSNLVNNKDELPLWILDKYSHLFPDMEIKSEKGRGFDEKSYKKSLTRKQKFANNYTHKSKKEKSNVEFLSTDGISTIYSNGYSTFRPDRVSSGPYTLTINPDGNIILYKVNKKNLSFMTIIWQSNTHRKEHKDFGGFKLVIQNDGNLVAYDKEEPYWSTRTNRISSVYKPYDYILDISRGRIELYGIIKEKFSKKEYDWYKFKKIFRYYIQPDRNLI